MACTGQMVFPDTKLNVKGAVIFYDINPARFFQKICEYSVF